MLECRVSLLPDREPVRDDVDVAIVIDVLRATSAITTALGHGASRVWTCREVADARSLRDHLRSQHGTEALLCGERQCRSIDGFDLGNSPAEYSADRVGQRELIFTTTNGTRAIESARPAQQIWLGSFLNRTALSEAIVGLGRDRSDTNPLVVHLVCSGTEGRLTPEDTLLAANLADEFSARSTVRYSGTGAREAMRQYRDRFSESSAVTPSRLVESFATGPGGQNLQAAGYQDDLRRCAELDRFAVIPRGRPDDQASAGLATCFL